MSALQLTKKYFFFFLAGVLLSCSSGGGEGGTGITDVSRGTITQFGSIFVNGVEFDTTNTNINLDGLQGNDTDLKLNMIVTVYGTINPDGLTGIADTVVVKEVLKGPVEAKSSSNSITVLGQTVEVSGATRFDGVAGLAGISVNSMVEISGYVKSNGLIAANRIELLSTNDSEYKLFGVAQNLDMVAQTFEFGALTIDYSSAVFSDLAPSSLENNAYLEVKGSYNPSISTLFATKIENGASFSGNAGQLEIEGFVTSITSPTEISIDHIPVMFDLNAEINGGTIDDLVVGTLVEAEGVLTNGTLVASEIEFEDPVRVEAQVGSVDLNAQTLGFTDMVGLSFQVNDFTEYSGDLPNGLASIVPGSDHVKVRGYRPDGSTLVVARSIEKQTTGGSVSLQGPVTFVDNPGFYILDVVVDTTGILTTNFTKDDQVIGPSAFFNEIAIDTIVKAEGTYNGSIITWEQVEIED
jgi:hypothetical protein